MKEAIITDLNGLYVEPTLVADSVTGVFVIQEYPKPEPNEDGTLPSPPIEDVELIDTGYTIAYVVPAGFYKAKVRRCGLRGSKGSV
ncbi:hypothetical protein BVG16_05655 [Paenibacillus selenitireducens]|uniref:Uncharacterized protein n=1 Tax=Paenibacillus selenitireducens TaxID=1324314 RepID=A0A1T2XK29_9BACL|nr:hypothetical protein [Paenibacillus selenitireducens]OPA80229.1 hypothetical protein BVG16_05655 [Paenibacillus selenitireducens]